MNPATDTSKSEAWELASIGLGVLNSNLEVKLCNPYLQNLLSSTEQELVGKNFLQFLDVDNHLRSHITSELSARNFWQGIIHSTNHALRIEIKRSESSLLDGDSANDVIYPLVIIDYSADYKKLKELSTAKSLAEKTDKAKSRFLSHMSHELRTPLNAILGFTQLMNIATDLSELQQDNLKEIESAGNYLLTLINEILDLSRIESGKIKLSEDTVYLEQLLSECLTLVKPIADKKNIQLNCVLTTERQLHTDHVRLKQVILNLLSNAIKYNTDNGLVVLHCHDLDDHNIRIEIQDSGPGIAPELLCNIFSPFELLGVDDKKVEGSGIGLMISRRLTKLMSGKIDVLSEPGHGSVFWLELPSVSLDTVEFQYFHEAAASRVPFHPEPFQVSYIGEDTSFAALLQRLVKIRERIQIRTFNNMDEATAGISFTSRACVFISEAIAHELAKHADTIHLPWNLSLIVVKEKNYSENNPSYTQLVKMQLPDSFKLTDILKIIDNSFLDGF
ncbi:MAG: HAMP domain-containing sensor histidine kinase [Pseudomonadota bacterium]